tara:strand:- start:96 stop:794 length:699 start_codon:yes stop_codon:yes gene_type:complete
MLITCYNCETVFQIDKTKIDPNGQQVRCSVCAHVWTVFADNKQERGLPKLNIEANRDEEAIPEETSQKLGGQNLRQEDLKKQKKKKANIFTWLLWISGISSLLLAAMYASIIYRSTITAYYPVMIPFFEMVGYNISYSSDNLSIHNLQTDWKDDILRVRGSIVNNGSMRIHTLPIRISVRDPSGLLLSTHEVWPDSKIIDSATSVPFFAQITIDADKKAEIQVDFISHRSAR